MMRAQTQESRHTGSAFTLIELLVTIGVMGILLAILLPVLAGANATARQTASLANLHTIGQVMEQYADRYEEAYPFGTSGVLVCSGVDIGISYSDPWQIYIQWPIVAYEVAPWSEFRGSFLSPGAVRDDDPDGGTGCGAPTSYVYSMSFTASPRVWSGDAQPDPDLIKPVHLGDVRFPSTKALVWDGELPYLRRELKYVGRDLDENTPMLLADSHAALHVPAQASEPVPNPFPDAAPNQSTRLHNTANGVQGRDYR